MGLGVGLEEKIKGIVIKAQSGFFTVKTAESIIICKIPKRLRYQKLRQQQLHAEQISDIVAVGDWVMIQLNKDESGVITEVLSRSSVLSRVRPSAEARQILQDREQIWVANPDQMIIVQSIHDPEPSLRKLDRFLVVAEANQLPAIICINKIDLASIEKAEAIFQMYRRIDYSILYTSIIDNIGIEELRSLLSNRISVVVGSSGVGKSSLLNAVQPGLGLLTGEISESNLKGKHTTRHVQLHSLEVGGYVADTPGVRSLALFGIRYSELDGFFREIAPLVAECGFSNCTHRHESNCAVQRAVKLGLISAERHESYIKLYEEHYLLDRKAY